MLYAATARQVNRVPGAAICRLLYPTKTHGIHVQIHATVVPLVEDMLKRETGAARVVVCDHTVRRGTIE